MTDVLRQIGADLREAAERRAFRRRRTLLIRTALGACAVAAAVAVSLLLAGSSLTGEGRQGEEEQRPADRQQQVPPPVATASCRIGEMPGYFVPGDGPLTLLGCVRLPVSGQGVDFSGNVGRIDGAAHLCINPAYGGGKYIPAICKLDPPVSQFAVRAAMQPRQGVEGYGYVVWGTAGEARSVVATFDGGVADAVRLVVPPAVARDYDVASFTLFALELPLTAACAPVAIEADGATAQVDPDPKACGAATQEPGE